MPEEESETQSSLKESEIQPVPARQDPERDLFAWSAPARPFKRRDRKFYVTVIAICVIVGLVLFVVEGFMPVILLASLAFLFYVLNTVEPGEVEYKITSKGIVIGGKRTDWGVMTRFWFGRRFDSELLIVETMVLPGRMELVVKSEDKDQIRKSIARYIPEEQASPSYLDKAADWFATKLPGNK